MVVKLSYSILNAWSSGKWEDAVSMYLGQDIPMTPYMELGRKMDKLWELEIERTKHLPKDLGGELMTEPVTQQKYEKLIPFSKGISILVRGVPDCTDQTDLHEFKCGMTTPQNYIDKMQLDYYKLLLPEIERGFYHCYNPYTKTHTRGVKFLTDKNALAALEHIITFGGEMIDYLQSQKMLRAYTYAG